MPIRVVVNGAQGKMGRVTVDAVSKDRDLQLVAQADKNINLKDIILETKAQVVVDFTSPLAAYENAVKIIDAGACPVIGTTGLSAEQIIALQERCAAKKLGGIIEPNFSLGANLMMRFVKLAAKYFPNCEIIEMHHPAKLDSPSGTALKTASLIAESRTEQPDELPLHETVPGARGAVSHDIPLHAIRLPGIVAGQQVIFGGQGETLSIVHNTISREAFMPGVLLACKKVVEIKELVVGLDHILF